MINKYQCMIAKLKGTKQYEDNNFKSGNIFLMLTKESPISQRDHRILTALDMGQTDLAHCNNAVWSKDAA